MASVLCSRGGEEVCVFLSVCVCVCVCVCVPAGVCSSRVVCATAPLSIFLRALSRATGGPFGCTSSRTESLNSHTSLNGDDGEVTGRPYELIGGIALNPIWSLVCIDQEVVTTLSKMLKHQTATMNITVPQAYLYEVSLQMLPPRTYHAVAVTPRERRAHHPGVRGFCRGTFELDVRT